MHCVASRFGYPNCRWSQLVRIIDVLLYFNSCCRNKQIQNSALTNTTQVQVTVYHWHLPTKDISTNFLFLLRVYVSSSRILCFVTTIIIIIVIIVIIIIIHKLQQISTFLLYILCQAETVSSALCSNSTNKIQQYCAIYIFNHA